MRRSRFAAAAAVALAASVALTGCGRDSGGGQDEAKSVAEGKASGEITVWAMGTEGEKLGEFAKEFSVENPDAKVNVTAVPWDAAHQKIASAIAAKQTPDVSMIGTTWQGEFAKTGALDPTPPDLIKKDDFFPGAWDTTIVDGGSYGVPWYVETRGIFYRKDLAAKAGFPDGPKTWEDLTAMAKAMQADGVREGFHLQPGKTGSWQSVMPFAWSNGAEGVTADKISFDTPEMTEALAYYQSFFKDKLSGTDLPEGALEPDFVSGKIGAFISGPWHIGLLQEKGGAGFEDKFAVAQMPMKKSATSFIGGSNLAVFKDAKNRDAGWKFVQWLSKPEVQVKWYQAVKDLPSVQSAWDDSSLSSDPYLAVFGKQLEDAKAPPAIPTWEQIAASFDLEVEKLCKSNVDPAAAAKAIQEKASAIGTGA
ncbi:sugar ABC transporter substrate-binding protein [Asanoa ishikariensis]|uniref:Carbohydrate ABC transporter substrate-binding protein, CUT1 family n=1 Tax=Asanoa ishikariensis TaxID=137265 RepID=A0A1H3TAW1_9ACTN|nr:sugar ABC transporter substrate-binding protein [Asanoa ishikariensis]GIF62754.1 sugar ABC transporter substrate-binding protein [Asanoa ishikariensis]SDZ47376.1 carbohydrate ABC transporter substrate-binding protein, CUT1 family [Asanoa ishikariensis]